MKKTTKFKKEKFGTKYYSKKNIHHDEIVRLMRDISPTYPRNVLDLGSGCGFYSEIYPDAKYVGLEISEKQIKYGKKLGNKIIKHDLENKFPFRSNSFDCILCIDCLEHIYDTFNFMKEIRRVLTKRGFALILTPNICSVESRLRMFFGESPPPVDFMRTKEIGQDHVSFFNAYTLKELCDYTGLKIINLRGWDNGLILSVLNVITSAGYLKNLPNSLVAVIKK